MRNKKDSALLLVGHGSRLNPDSSAPTWELADEIERVYMEEESLISHWDSIATQPNVVVVPFFIADGLHSYEDIPVLLGITEQSLDAASANRNAVFARNPYQLRGGNLFYASSIGTEPGFADIILDQVTAFNQA